MLLLWSNTGGDSILDLLIIGLFTLMDLERLATDLITVSVAATTLSGPDPPRWGLDISWSGQSRVPQKAVSAAGVAKSGPAEPASSGWASRSSVDASRGETEGESVNT